MPKKLITKKEVFLFEPQGENIDLNDYIEPGFYHSTVDTLNAPVNTTPGIFFVYSINDESDAMIIQFYISYFMDTKLKLFTRFYTLNTWSSWITI